MKALLTLSFCLLISSGCSYTNFYEVSPGKFYRSAQLSSEDLEGYVQENGIKTVINLRGANSHKTWFLSELMTCSRLGVQYFNIGLSARRIPRKQELVDLLKIYQRAERPILVHCQGGADRSGLASAIYGLEYLNWTKDEAEEMLSLRFLHVALATPSQRYFLEQYQGRLWAFQEFDPDQQDFLYHEKTNSN